MQVEVFRSASPAHWSGRQDTVVLGRAKLGQRRFGNRISRSQRTQAARKYDINELEIRMAIVKEEMAAAAREERFEEAATLRDRLDHLYLKFRCTKVQHSQDLIDSIRYRLGQVIKHKRYQYRGVIFGVHSSCEASETWIQAMGVDKLSKGRDQPFYQVLVDFRDKRGDVITYVAQENIDLSLEAETIEHRQISEMFTTFDPKTSTYNPTPRLVSMYPDSLEARALAAEDGSDMGRVSDLQEDRFGHL